MIKMNSPETSVTAVPAINNTSEATTNVTTVTNGPQIWSSREHIVVTSVVLGLIILCTIIGNALVTAAIILDKNLNRVANYLILSLAVTDGMVAAVVMPVSAVNEMSQRWIFSSAVCAMWILTDVLFCTASILNLVAISIDRYWAVSKRNYIRLRTSKRVIIMIVTVWIVALTISIPFTVLSNDENDPTKTGTCMISQDYIYTIFSTVCSFYLPAVVLLIIYANIYVIAKKRINGKKSSLILKLEKQQSNKIIQKCNSSPEVKLLPEQTNMLTASKSEISLSSLDSQYVNEERGKDESSFPVNGVANKMSNSCKDILKAQKKKDKRNRKRERKVAWTLKIITGTFIMCWLPFFIITTIAPFIRLKVNIPRPLESITLWLGYCNCLLNPIIYSLFNTEFRTAFKNLLSRKTPVGKLVSSDNTT